MDPVLQLLDMLIAIDSVNPSLVPGAAGEAAIADAVADAMRCAGLEVERQDAAPGRPNVIGVLEGRAPGRSLLLCGHVDTVGVEGMEAPFAPRHERGRVYGRGAQDMKAGVAAMIDAARTIATSRFAAGRLIVAAVVDEEFASIGADALVQRWRADAAIVTEPTDLQISIGHKGFAWLEVQTAGRAAHGSRPAEGRDAILRMGRVLRELERLDRALQARTAHPILATGSLHASMVDGGAEWSSYPARCALRMERRLTVAETGNDALAEVQEILDRLRADDPEFEATASLTFWRPPYELDAAHPLPCGLAEAAAEHGVRTAMGGMSFWTDAAVLASAGIPSVLFGPGGAGLHGIEEYVNEEDVLTCRDVLARFAWRWCGGDARA